MTPKMKAQKELQSVLKPTYFERIPLNDIFQAIKNNGGLAVDIDGTAWEGFLLGNGGYTSINVTGIKGLKWLNISWYKMQSGRYEVTGYLS